MTFPKVKLPVCLAVVDDWLREHLILTTPADQYSPSQSLFAGAHEAAQPVRSEYPPQTDAYLDSCGQL